MPLSFRLAGIILLGEGCAPDATREASAQRVAATRRRLQPLQAYQNWLEQTDLEHQRREGGNPHD